ncbi:MAG: acyl-CoA dehydrogenase family protein, partial [Deltaproteobacteria bacterium]|nr:acyl-CoA dehydrogenase family protein [Deltaproteobacteria bacterium]
MNILNYTDKHKDFREQLQAFVASEVTPNVDKWEKDGLVPNDVWRQMGRNGFLCTDVPQNYGGLGGDFLYSLIVTEELSYSMHTGLAAVLHSDVVVPYITAFGSEELKHKYLPGCVSGDIITAIAMTEPGAGSDLANIATTAEEEGDQVILNGSKTFISNGINGELFIVAARDPSVENPYQAISLYLIEDGTPGFERGRHLEKMGWRSQDTAELFFSKCRIPVANRLGEKGAGFLMLMQKLQQERLMCALGAQVAAERMVEWTTDYCKNTKINGKPLSKSQVTQFALVDMAAEICIGRAFIEKLVAEHMEQKDIIVETSMAKFWTTEMANRVADRSVD